MCKIQMLYQFTSRTNLLFKESAILLSFVELFPHAKDAVVLNCAA
jgi:hypothetical protein